MPPKSNLNTIQRDFMKAIRSAVSLYNAMVTFADKSNTWDAIQGWEPVHPAQARRVIALAFMQMVSAWEEFVEGCFLRYMAGGASPSGWRPDLRIGPCNSIAHAAQILTRDPSFGLDTGYINWSAWSQVVSRSSLYFRRAEPFSSVLDFNRQRLADAFVIRNRVAHFSRKARTDFTKLAKRHIEMSDGMQLPRGFDVGELLLSEPRIFPGRDSHHIYFFAYLDLFVRLASIIAPVDESVTVAPGTAENQQQLVLKFEPGES